MQGCLIKGASAMFCSTELSLFLAPYLCQRTCPDEIFVWEAGPAGKKAASSPQPAQRTMMLMMMLLCR